MNMRSDTPGPIEVKSFRTWPYLLAYLAMAVAGFLLLRSHSSGSVIAHAATSGIGPLPLLLAVHLTRKGVNNQVIAVREKIKAEQEEGARMEEARQEAAERARRLFSLEVRGVGLLHGKDFNLDLLCRLDQEEWGGEDDEGIISATFSREARVLNAACGWSTERLSLPVVVLAPEAYPALEAEERFRGMLKDARLYCEKTKTESMRLRLACSFPHADAPEALAFLFTQFETQPELPAVLLWVEGSQPPSDGTSGFMTGMLFTRTETLVRLRERLETELKLRDNWTPHGEVTSLHQKPTLVDRSWFLGMPDQALLAALERFMELPVLAHLPRPQFLGEEPTSVTLRVNSALDRLTASLPEATDVEGVVHDAGEKEVRVAWLRAVSEKFPDLDVVNDGLDLSTALKEPNDGRVGLLLALAVLRAHRTGETQLAASMGGDKPVLFALRPPADNSEHPSGQSAAHVTRSWLDGRKETWGHEDVVAYRASGPDPEDEEEVHGPRERK